MDGDLRKYTGILEQISRYRCGVNLDSRQFFGIDLHFFLHFFSQFFWRLSPVVGCDL